MCISMRSTTVFWNTFRSKGKKPWFYGFFDGLHPDNQIYANFHYDIRNQRVKIRKYTYTYIFWGTTYLEVYLPLQKGLILQL